VYRKRFKTLLHFDIVLCYVLNICFPWFSHYIFVTTIYKPASRELIKLGRTALTVVCVI
jgi:hypothetical protein